MAVVASKGETSKSKSGKRGPGAGEAMPGAHLSSSPAKSDKGKEKFTGKVYLRNVTEKCSRKL